MTTQLAFHNTQFNVINHNNQIWLTAVEIARALCYKSDDAVTKIYNRNIDEFSPGMSETVNLGVSGNLEKSVRIFSLRGAHLIAMLARTPVAKEFRRWVLDILDREVAQPAVQPISQAPRPPTDTPISASMIIYLENGIPVASRPLMPGDFVMNANSCLEHVMRCGFVVIPWEKVGEMSLDALYKMAEQAKRLNEQATGEMQELVEKYGI